MGGTRRAVAARSGSGSFAGGVRAMIPPRSTVAGSARGERQLIVRTGCWRAARTLIRAATIPAMVVIAWAAAPGSR